MSRFKDKVILSPDYSIYTDYPEPVQRWNVYRSRWLGAYYQSQGVHVIPSVSWADERSYLFCFSGIEEGSTVAISTLGCSGFSELFSAGVDAMIDHIQPATILCYGNFRKTYTGHRLIPNLANYPHHFGTFGGSAVQHKPLVRY